MCRRTPCAKGDDDFRVCTTSSRLPLTSEGVLSAMSCVAGVILTCQLLAEVRRGVRTTCSFAPSWQMVSRSSFCACGLGCFSWRQKPGGFGQGSGRGSRPLHFVTFQASIWTFAFFRSHRRRVVGDEREREVDTCPLHAVDIFLALQCCAWGTGVDSLEAECKLLLGGFSGPNSTSSHSGA